MLGAPVYHVTFPTHPTHPLPLLAVCLCAARHQISHLLEGVDPYVASAPFPAPWESVPALLIVYGRQLQRKVVVCGDGACGAQVLIIPSVNTASFDVQYRQDLAAKRIHAWLLHTSLARRPLFPDSDCVADWGMTLLVNQPSLRTMSMTYMLMTKR